MSSQRRTMAAMLGRALRRKRASKAFIEAARRRAIRQADELAKAKYVVLRREYEAQIKAGVVKPAKALAHYNDQCARTRAAHKHIVSLLVIEGGESETLSGEKEPPSGSTPSPNGSFLRRGG